MRSNLLSKLYRVLIILTIIGMIGFVAPQKALAAAPSVQFTDIKPGESVTVKVTGFPAGAKAVIRMDRAWNTGALGVLVDEAAVGSDGSFEGTFKIPESLKTTRKVAFYVSTASGYYAYDWFENRAAATSSGSASTTGATTAGSSTAAAIAITAVVQNEQITVHATHFPANTTFTVKVGPYHDFYKKGEVMKTFTTTTGGNFDFNIDLPASVNGVELVTVWVTSEKFYVYNAFTNVDAGTINPNPGEKTPAAAACEVVSVVPASLEVLEPDTTFVATWTVKNLSDEDWAIGTVDYVYDYGYELQRFSKYYDVTEVVPAGGTVELAVPMVTPLKVNTYSTTWALKVADQTVCELPLLIWVK